MRLLALALAALVGPSAAAASITVAANVSRPALRVDAAGSTEVSWTAGGARHTLLVPVRGRVIPGGRTTGADVSRAVAAPMLPFGRVVRQGHGGWYYALQAWRVLPGGPVEVRFARWRGEPTVARLAATQTSLGVRLTGRVTFGGRAIPTTSRTPEGKVLRQYVYLDSFVRGAWKRLGGVASRGDGSFRRTAPGSDVGERYRALVPGPNIGTTFAPDAVTLATT